MTDKSAAELEKDAEVARAKVANTAESIRDKMSPGQLIDEFAGMFSGGDGQSALSNLKAQVRDNPLALSLIGAGLVWLMVGEPASRAASSAWDSSTSQAKAPDRAAMRPDDHGRPEGNSDVWSTMSEAAGSVADTAKDAAGSVGAAASDAVDRITGGIATTTANTTDRLRQGVQQGLQQEPLVLAALGFAVGAAIGGLLPHSKVEDEAVGEISDEVRGKAEEILQTGLETGKQVAAETFEALKEEADKQGLTDTGASTVVEKIGDVAKAAASKAEKSLRERSS